MGRGCDRPRGPAHSRARDDHQAVGRSPNGGAVCTTGSDRDVGESVRHDEANLCGTVDIIGRDGRAVAERELVAQRHSGRAERSFQLWNLLNLSFWFEHWTADQEPAPTASQPS